MNYCNCPNCRTENCPAASDETNNLAPGAARPKRVGVREQRMGRLRAMMVDRSEEVLNHIGGVTGYRIRLDEEDTRRVFELLDGDGTEPTS